MINEIQHRILNNPKVQLLIQELDCTIVDGNQQTRSDIANSVDSWLKEAEKALPSQPASQSDADIKAWITMQRQANPNWSPF